MYQLIAISLIRFGSVDNSYGCVFFAQGVDLKIVLLFLKHNFFCECWYHDRQVFFSIDYPGLP